MRTKLRALGLAEKTCGVYRRAHRQRDCSISMDGKKLDDSSVQALLSKLRDLSAEAFPDSGFTAPMMEITVTSNDNKRIEKVAVAKSGEKYIAKRENEPALYELTASTIPDLEKAASELKPAAPPAPAPATKKK